MREILHTQGGQLGVNFISTYPKDGSIGEYKLKQNENLIAIHFTLLLCTPGRAPLRLYTLTSANLCTTPTTSSVIRPQEFQTMRRSNVNFHVHPTILTLVQNSQYSGLPSEDPHAHITRFIRARGIYRQEGVSEEIIRLKLFPFSVIGEAARWLESQDVHHFRSWQQLHKGFMNEFFLITKAMRIRRHIQEFKQALPKAKELIERISKNTSCWYDRREEHGGMYEVNSHVANEAKIEAMNHEIKKLQAMVKKMEGKTKPYMALALYCNICGGLHDTNICTSPSAAEHVEAVDYQRGPSYNAYGGNQRQNNNWKQGDGWNNNDEGFQTRVHYNYGNKPTYRQNEKGRLTYGQNQGNGGQMTHYKPQYNSQLDYTQQRRDDIRKVDERLTRTIMELKNDRANLKQEITHEIRQEISSLRQESKATLKTIENQISQMFKMISERHYGQLPSNIENNPKERVNAIEAVEERHDGCDPIDIICGICNSEKGRMKEKEKTTSCSLSLETNIEDASCRISMKREEGKITSCDQIKENVSQQCKVKTSKEKERARKGTFNAFIQKFFNDKQCHKLFEDDTCDDYACLSKEITTCMTTGYPIKKGDPGALVVPCSIKDMDFPNALVDLGASINLMPSSLFERLSLPSLKPTRLSLRLGDGTTQ
ncbi:uncharacterized protein LOC115999397 [Ipomoea triloba]|uniref:uncharacterized protein LOC115999397 n=1 Tax=Ipomoea triloba TaxID=35885 RepID=UPI00125E0D84|nr:uncharacterized protein LOC115999397 [Ipomoea triloba]